MHKNGAPIWRLQFIFLLRESENDLLKGHLYSGGGTLFLGPKTQNSFQGTLLVNDLKKG